MIPRSLMIGLQKLKAVHASALLRDSLKCRSHLTLIERQALYRLSSNLNSIAEIGSYLGASACCFAAAPKSKDKVIYCIDTWDNNAMTEGNWNTWHAFRHNTKKYSSNIVPLRGWSTEMAEHLARYTESVDLLFIDGAHDYGSVKADWESYKSFLRVGSIVVFHDIGWAEGVQKVVCEDVESVTKDHRSLPNMWWGTMA